MGKRILVLVEGLEASREALRFARAVARRLGGTLELLVLLPLHLEPRRDRRALQRRGERLADGWATGDDPEQPPAAAHVRPGDPWSEFCKFAATSGARYQLVIWATGGARADGRAGWPSGHWAARIPVELGCPVVIAQHRAGADRGGDRTGARRSTRG